MHPGQYTVLNSKNTSVVENAIEELEYHAKFLDMITENYTHKIVLHIGGIYGNKKKAIERFICNFDKLSSSVKNRLIIENDERNYTIEEVLYISSKIDVPVVFDNLHNQINGNFNINDVFESIISTWKDKDGTPKFHYSQQSPFKRIGSHTQTIEPYSFFKYINQFTGNIDIMLEVKDKNISTEKIIKLLHNDSNTIRNEWGKYKYNVMDKSYNDYKNISKYVNSNNPKLKEFINMLDKSYSRNKVLGEEVNSINHIWGYFKNIADKEEKETLFRMIEEYKEKSIDIKKIKKFLYDLSVKYNIEYLLKSYYFNNIG